MLPLICFGQRLSDLLLDSRAFPAACWIAFRLALRYPVTLRPVLSEIRQIGLLDLFITRHHNSSSYPTPNTQSLQLCQDECCSFICLPLLRSSAFQIRAQPCYACPTGTALGIFWLLSNKITLLVIWSWTCVEHQKRNASNCVASLRHISLKASTDALSLCWSGALILLGLWETSGQMLVKPITVYMGLLERLWGHVEPRCKCSGAFKIIQYQLCRYMDAYVFGVSVS